jgi:hypothetical protein
MRRGTVTTSTHRPEDVLSTADDLLETGDVAHQSPFCWLSIRLSDRLLSSRGTAHKILLKSLSFKKNFLTIVLKERRRRSVVFDGDRDQVASVPEDVDRLVVCPSVHICVVHCEI